MVNLKNNKGITLMAEVITIVILLIIVSVITYSSMANLEEKKLNDMYSDILNIQEKAINYYFKYGEAPISNDIVNIDNINIPASQINPNDEGGYYKIDFSKLLNTTLNNKETDKNYYFMNEKTLTTYYSAGVTTTNSEMDIIYHTLPSNYKNINLINLSIYQDEI